MDSSKAWVDREEVQADADHPSFLFMLFVFIVVVAFFLALVGVVTIVALFIHHTL